MPVDIYDNDIDGWTGVYKKAPMDSARNPSGLYPFSVDSG